MYQEVNLTGKKLASKNLTGVISLAGGTKNYNQLLNKPSINNVELSGNKTGYNLGLVDIDTVSSVIVGKKSEGATALFNTDLSDVPFLSLITDIESSQEGITDVQVSVSGKNLFNPALIEFGTFNNDTWILSPVAGDSGKIAYNGIFKENTRYTITGYEVQTAADTNVRLRIYYTDGTTQNVFTDITTTGKSFTITSNANKTIASINIIFSAVGSVTISNFQIEEGTSSSSYEAFKGAAYTVNLGESLTQGGKLNLITGLLTRTDKTTKQLDKISVISVSGDNYIYSNRGNVEVIYFLSLGGVFNE